MHYLLVAAAITSAAPLPMSGQYGILKLAFSGGRVTGAFLDARQGNGTDGTPQFTCAFAVAGGWMPGTKAAPVLTWWPGEHALDTRIRGRLTMDGATATLSLDDDPGGCDMTGDDFRHTPFSDDLSARRAWLEVRHVRSARAQLRNAPGGAARRTYLVSGDTVGILGRIGGFVHVEYVDGDTPVSGWLPTADLETGSPPAPGRR